MNTASQRNPITAFIAGEVPLSRMFWLHGVVAGFAAGMALGGLGGISAELQRIWAVLLLAYLLAWYIGLWRSANRYTGPAAWKWAARAVVAMPFVGIVLTLLLSVGHKQGTTAPSQLPPQAPPSAIRTPTAQEQWVPAPQNLKPFEGKLDGEK